jgi:NO-binding membrane sensor protein with MHYT domain
MTLSHGPWLVLLSRMVAVHSNHVGRLFARKLKRTGRLCRFALLDRALPTPETGVQSMSFVGMRPARNASPLSFPFPSKYWCHSALAGSAWEHPPIDLVRRSVQPQSSPLVRRARWRIHGNDHDP